MERPGRTRVRDRGAEGALSLDIHKSRAWLDAARQDAYASRHLVMSFERISRTAITRIAIEPTINNRPR